MMHDIYHKCNYAELIEMVVISTEILLELNK